MASVGIFLGQILFGFMGGTIGQKKAYGKELMFTMFGLLMTIGAPPSVGVSGVMAWISVFRVVTGLGIGGDYSMGNAYLSVFVLLGFSGLSV